PIRDVRDDALARLKRDHPAEMVRLHSVGEEMTGVLGARLRREAFLRDQALARVGPAGFSDRREAPLHALMWGWHLVYLLNVTSGGFDRMIDEADRAEVTIRERDFGGPDTTGWVYDLFRPHEPFSARGVHPTGRGVDRYVRYAQLRN